MSKVQETSDAGHLHIDPRRKSGRRFALTEDWLAVEIGVGLVALAYLLFISGTSIKWLAIAPARWTTFSAAVGHLFAHLGNYVALFVLFSAVFGLAAGALTQNAGKFVRAFSVLYIVSAIIFIFGAWASASRYNLEPPLVALGLGLVVSNVFRVPGWLLPALRVEFYVKVGIVLLGATLPLTLLAWAGPVALFQAGIVSLLTFFVIFGVARWLGIDKRFASVLGVGGAVCGVSAAIAIGGAVRAKREQPAVAITLVVIWAIVMVFALPFVSRELGLPTGIAGAWIGTSEFADAAGIAAAQAYGDLAAHASGAIAGAPEASVQAFTLMKVVGRDIWIGIWAFVLALLASTRWEREDARKRAAETGGVASGQAGAADSQAVVTQSATREIWGRFPKFVIGFLITSLLVTWLASHYSLADYRRVVTPDFIAPIVALRTWAFTFCFLSIGLTTRFADLKHTGSKPFIAFTAGVIVNVLIGYWLSVHTFGHYWASLGS